MVEVTRAEQARLDIITFRIVAAALLLRGYYRLSGTVGERLENALRDLSPEMEGGHYQRAINAAIIQGNISEDVKLRYAYYASDNPLLSGETLASGILGSEGVGPKYMITKAIVEKIFQG
jgi:hypothetical protein